MSKEKMIARPYAKAVFELASEAKTLDAWSAMLFSAAALVQMQEFSAILKDPRLSADWLVETMVAVLPNKLDREQHAFLALMAAKKRCAILPAVQEFFEAYKAKAQHVCPVHITVAYDLTKEQRDFLNAAISRHVGKELALTYETDSNILGGALVHIGDELIDGSVRGRLETLATALRVAI